jgi:hypothetical protein
MRRPRVEIVVKLSACNRAQKCVTNWIALALIVAVVITTAAIFSAGRKSGAAAESAKAREAELESQKEASDAKDRMLEAVAAAPRDRDALADRLRRLEDLPPGAALDQAMLDYTKLRDQARACGSPRS